MSNNIKAKKKFGQNFLIDNNIQNKIIDCANLSVNDVVVEVGPGRGAITKLMLPRVKKVIAYEIDRDLVEFLSNSIQNNNFELINQDFLKVELPNLKYKVIANIPYYITSDILFKLFDNTNNIEFAILMVQKEVALRLIAQPSTSHYSKLSATATIYGETQILFNVSPASFNPSPKVESSIIKITFNKKITNEHLTLRKFIANCFQFRRKILLSNLKNIYKKDKILKVFELLNFSPNIRAQELSFDHLINLFDKLK